MSNTKYVLLDEAVTFNGAIVEAGEVIELTAKSAQALVNEGKGRHAEPDEETNKALGGQNGGKSPEGTESSKTGETPDPHLTPSADPNNEAGDENEDLALVKKALNDKYTRDELADEAKKVGVEFPYNAKKGEIIDAVIKAGKADVLLQK